MTESSYLGDGLYASHDGHQFWLVASNGLNETDRVALDQGVLLSFLGYSGRRLV